VVILRRKKKGPSSPANKETTWEARLFAGETEKGVPCAPEKGERSAWFNQEKHARPRLAGCKK